MRLFGNIEARTDVKGRVFLPAAFRKMLQGDKDTRLVLRKDVYQPCLALYPESSWEELLATLRSRINRWDPRQSQIYRQFLADVETVSPDGSGRILIPRRLLDAAHIDQSIRFIGMGDYIEVWSGEQTQGPFVADEEFKQELARLMGGAPEASGEAAGKEVL